MKYESLQAMMKNIKTSKHSWDAWGSSWFYESHLSVTTKGGQYSEQVSIKLYISPFKVAWTEQKHSLESSKERVHFWSC